MTDGALEFTKKFAAALKKLRLEKGLSHDKLAERAGITRPAISYIESGSKTPTLATCYKLSVALDVPLSALIHSIETDK